MTEAGLGDRGVEVSVKDVKVIRTVMSITGMRDSRCREAVSEVLGSVRGVQDVDVNLFRAYATVVHDAKCTPAELIRAVVEKGYGASLADESDRAKH